MKFVSKSSNLRVVLRPGIPGSAIVGREPVSGIYVKFQDGIAIINQQEQIDMMINHPAFDRDFICVEEVQKDPYAYNRQETEPGHIIQEIKYGHVENMKSSAKNVQLTPQMNKLIDDLASARVKEMLPGVIESVLKGITKVHEEKNKQQVEDSVEEKNDVSNENSENIDVNKVLGVQPEPIEANEAYVDQDGEKKVRRGRPPMKKTVE